MSAPYAAATPTVAWLGFRCPAGPGRAGNTVLTVNIMTYHLEKGPDRRPREDLTLVAYGTALKLAEQMNCRKESRLPGKPGPLKTLA